MDTAVVTGAGRGIGREIAARLAGRGYAVLATDVDADAARQTAEELGAPAWSMPLDVRDAEAHRAAAAVAAERGPLAVWVNNAGVLRADKAWDQSDEEVRLLVEANLLGVMWGCRAAVDAMRARGGHIVNMASLSSLAPVPGITTYAATKHGVLGFTTSLQGDLQQAGIPIRVHAVCPDTVDTGMVRERAGEPEAAIVYSAPRILEASEVADRVVALLDSRRVVAVVPAWRGWLLRALAPFPRLALGLVPVFRWIGERKRARAR